MIVTYRCKCGHVFSGHWHEAKKRLKQFPNLQGKLNVAITMVCPKCGNQDSKTNIDFDEDFNPDIHGPSPEGGQDDK